MTNNTNIHSDPFITELSAVSEVDGLCKRVFAKSMKKTPMTLNSVSHVKYVKE